MRREITPEIYASLVEAFELHPGDRKAASLATGVSWRTADRAWREGWPPDMLPISCARARTVRVEATKAVAEIVRSVVVEAHAERAMAAIMTTVEDAAQAVAEAAELGREARKGCLPLLQAMSVLNAKAGTVAERLAEQVESGEYPPDRALALMIKLSREANEAARVAIELGATPADPSVSPTQAMPATFEDAERDISHAFDLMALAKRRRELRAGVGKTDAARTPDGQRTPGARSAQERPGEH